MRMFLPVSGHSGELIKANHSPRSTVLQQKCVSDTISSWFDNHQSQKTKVSTVIYAPFIQNSNQMASRPQVFRGYFFNSCNSQGNDQGFYVHRAAPMTKTDLIFPAFSSRFVDFAVQFCFHSTRSDARVRFDSGAIFLDQSQFLATHGKQWNCFILYRS